MKKAIRLIKVIILAIIALVFPLIISACYGPPVQRMEETLTENSSDVTVD